MSFRLDSRNYYQADALSALDWLEHGFGTRHATPPEHAITVKQIHSDIVVLVNDAEGNVGPGDALVSSRPGSLLLIRTADCIPVLLADTRVRAVAAVHAGWRGTASSIVAKTIEAMKEAYGTNPEDVVAAIGPGIGECCYEVGPEVARQFEAWFPEHADAERPVCVDLWRANRRQLLEKQIPLRQVHVAEMCTQCDSSLFHSFRRDRDMAGRMVSYIGIRK